MEARSGTFIYCFFPSIIVFVILVLYGKINVERNISTTSAMKHMINFCYFFRENLSLLRKDQSSEECCYIVFEFGQKKITYIVF